MGLFTNPIPPPPAPRSPFSPDIQRQSQDVSKELQDRLRKLENFLAMFSPAFITGTDGNRWEVLARPAGTGGGHAFQLIATTSGGSPAIRVVYGIVNSIVPGGMNLSDDPPFILTGISGSGYVYLKTTTHATTGDLVSVAINKASSMPPEEATHHHLAIGTFVSSGGSVTVAQGISGSQAFELCGGPTGGTATWGLV